MTKKIPFFDYPKLFLNNKEHLVNIFENVGSKGAFILQNELLEFERNLAKFSGSKFAVGVGNASDALQIGLKLGGIKEGDEIIISTHTMIATAGSIIQVGGIPIPVDIGDDHLINYDLIENHITSKTKAIMPTQLNGRTCNMDKIEKICKKYNLMIFEDAAQGLGSKFKGKGAGTFGVASAISFYPAKNLGCLGDGGAILLNDEELYREVVAYRDHGRHSKTGEVISWGINSRLDNLQAAFLSFFLDHYENVIGRRRYIAQLYNELLKDNDQIELPPAPNNNSDHFDVYQNYEIRANNRDELVKFLYDRGVGTLLQWSGKAIHHHKNLGFSSNLDIADKYFKKILMIPMNMFISDNDVYYIAEEINNFYRKS